MGKINWRDEVEQRKGQLLKDLQGLLQIKSVLDEENASEGAPFGPDIKKAMDYLLSLGERAGMGSKNVDGYAAHLEIGQGEDLIGILCHLDVVPEGDGWSVDPYKGVIKDGKIIARGASDDKGPTMAAFYGMKIIQELNLPLSKRVRMIIGGDEESKWRCVDHYFKHEEMPSMGFAPDADFPIIHAEKGICNAQITLKATKEIQSETPALLSFLSGRRLNMVPDLAKAVLSDISGIEEKYQEFLTQENVKGTAFRENGNLVLHLEGTSAHGSTPECGVNAGVMLAKFLSNITLDQTGTAYLKFITDSFLDDHYGKKLNVAAEDEVSGKLTVNPGVFSYTRGDGGHVSINIRYPVKHRSDVLISQLDKAAKEKGWSCEILSNSKPHYVSEDHVLVQTLKRVYEEQTGEDGKPIAIGGGTYARSLDAGVAFGALFPGREDVAHQKDEYMYVEDLIKAAAIYAQAIYELAK
ncbi:dipeptidase PepV [Fictibacillus sp. Mic-4]|uniref:dipeptidase PepV n=1 Tax=Fictibacillus sp. Mic-4 TaxID=3132826 RepID=UPI003CF29005